MKKIIINLALFQIGWVICVIGGNLYAIGFTTAALLIHNWLVLSSKSEWKFIASVAVVGCLWDSAMSRIGIINFVDVNPLAIPLWLACLWLLFATTFMHGLFWLSRHLWLSAVFAALLGPATYWVGASLTDVRLGLPIIMSLLVMAAGWAILFPFGIYIAGRLKT